MGFFLSSIFWFLRPILRACSDWAVIHRHTVAAASAQPFFTPPAARHLRQHRHAAGAVRLTHRPGRCHGPLTARCVRGLLPLFRRVTHAESRGSNHPQANSPGSTFCSKQAGQLTAQRGSAQRLRRRTLSARSKPPAPQAAYSSRGYQQARP